MRFPIYFTKNICIHCGARGHLVYKDIRGIESKSPIYPITKIVCKKCGTEYFPKWINMNNDTDMIPVCTDRESIKDFEEVIEKYSLENKRKII
jgi:ribosomal protein L40E